MRKPNLTLRDGIFAARLARRRTPPGSPPGTLSPAPGAGAPVVELIAYGADAIERLNAPSVADMKERLGRHTVTWVNVNGLGDVELIRDIGEAFGLHQLALEDVVNLHQRPKAETFEDYIFVASRMPLTGRPPETEQVTLFIGKDYVLSFQEKPGDWFDPVRSRIVNGRGRVRSAGPDYLAYTLLDAIVDSYFPVLEALGDQVEATEERVYGSAGRVAVEELHGLKHDLLHLRRAIWPQRDLFAQLSREESPLIDPATRIYLRDCYDHAVQLIDIVETDRELVSDLFDLQLSAINLRMNEVMKVLTIIATVFIPLGFVAGVYGMNFSPDASPLNMPELRWYWGYPFAIGLMTVIAAAIVFYLWRRGWLGSTDGLNSAPRGGDDARP